MLRYIPLGAVVDISRVKYDADVHAAISIIRIRLGRRRIAYYVVSLGAVWNGKAISAVMLDSDVTQDGTANVVWTSFWILTYRRTPSRTSFGRLMDVVLDSAVT